MKRVSWWDAYCCVGLGFIQLFAARGGASRFPHCADLIQMTTAKRAAR